MYNHIKETTLHKLEVTKKILSFCDWCDKWLAKEKKINVFSLTFIYNHLYKRSVFHDLSKFEKIEKETFEKVKPKIGTFDSNSKEAIAARTLLGEALDHHYKNNSHHPEYYEDGIDGMNILDVIEMLCDWWAVAEIKNADIYTFIESNSSRFSISQELKEILIGTVDFMTGQAEGEFKNLFWLINEQCYIDCFSFAEGTPQRAYVSHFPSQIGNILANSANIKD